MNNETENNQNMTVEEFVAKLKELKRKNEDGLDKAQEELDRLEESEPDCDGAKYEKWQDKYDLQQLLVDSFTENIEKINSYLVKYDTDKV